MLNETVVILDRRSRQVKLAQGDLGERPPGAAPWRQVALVGLGLPRGRRHVEILTAVSGGLRLVVVARASRALLQRLGHGQRVDGLRPADHHRQSVFALVHELSRLLQVHIVGLDAGDARHYVSGFCPSAIPGDLPYIQPTSQHYAEVVLLAGPGQAQPVALALVVRLEQELLLARTHLELAARRRGSGLAGARTRGQLVGHRSRGTTFDHQEDRRARVPQNPNGRPVVGTLEGHAVRRDYPVVYSEKRDRINRFIGKPKKKIAQRWRRILTVACPRPAQP